MREAFLTIIIEALRVCFALATLILTRWLLGMSTPEDDMRWVDSWPLWDFLHRLNWYRGVEYFHQVRAWRLLGQ
jgi:hypothetical protein